jgi:hypothetical protein
MEREYNQFTPELLQMMRDEEREKFLAALKDGASWAQLYQIRNTIRKLNDMIESAENIKPDHGAPNLPGRGEEENPRGASSFA